MSKECRSTNVQEVPARSPVLPSSFGFRISFVIANSSFVIHNATPPSDRPSPSAATATAVKPDSSAIGGRRSEDRSTYQEGASEFRQVVEGSRSVWISTCSGTARDMVETGACDRIQAPLHHICHRPNERKDVHNRRGMKDLACSSCGRQVSPRRWSKMADICVRLWDLVVPRTGRS